MKKFLMAGLLLSSFICATQANAEEGNGYVGLGLKSLVITVDNGVTISSFSWGGLAFVGGYDVTDYISLNGSYYTLTETTDANSEMKGFDAEVRFGPNSLGFTYYGSLGYFSDTWNGSTSGVSQDYSGALLGLGIGYNWENVNLNWNIFSIRSSSDYQGNSTADYSVGSGSLSLAYRF